MGNKNKGLSFSTWRLEGKSSKSTTGSEGLKCRQGRVASWGDAPSLPHPVLWNQTLACHLRSHHISLIYSGKPRSREEAPDPSAQHGICPGKEGAQQTLRKLPDQRKPPLPILPESPPARERCVWSEGPAGYAHSWQEGTRRSEREFLAKGRVKGWGYLGRRRSTSKLGLTSPQCSPAPQFRPSLSLRRDCTQAESPPTSKVGVRVKYRRSLVRCVWNTSVNPASERLRKDIV